MASTSSSSDVLAGDPVTSPTRSRDGRPPNRDVAMESQQGSGQSRAQQPVGLPGAPETASMEEALRASQAMLQLVLDNIPQAVFWKNRDLVFIGCNRNFALDAGIGAPENIIGLTDYDLAWSREQADAYRRWDEEVMSSGVPRYHIVETQTRADGSQAWLDTNKIPLLDAAGRVIGLMGTYEDITDRKRAEAALQQAHDELELRVAQRTAELARSNERLRQEIAERQRAEDALRQSRERFALAVSAGKVGVWEWDLRTQDFYLDPSLKAMLGCEDLPARTCLAEWMALIEPADRHRVYAAVQAQLRAPNGAYEQEYRMRHRDGSPRWVLSRGRVVFDDDGRPVRIIGSATDVTRLKQVEEREREQRTLAEALRDTAALLSSTLDLAEVLERILANIHRVVPHDWAEILLIESGDVRCVGRRADPALGLPGPPPTPPDALQTSPTLRQMFATGQLLIAPPPEVLPFATPEPSPSWVRSYLGVPIRVEQTVIGFINLYSGTADFFRPLHADRLQAFGDQAALAIQNARSFQQARELAAMQERQRLARDLHDQVSQTLWTANLLVDVLGGMIGPDQAEVLATLERLRHLTRGALAEMRTLLLELRPAALVESDLGSLLEQLAQAAMSRKRIDVRVSVQGECHPPAEVQVAFYRIAQEALNNILKHARARRAWLQLVCSDDRVCLSIRDNGRGFAVGAVEPGRLGLGIMRERAESVGARLSVSSQIGHGTEVAVTWPAGEVI